MRKQSRKRQAELIAQFPLLGAVMEAYNYIRPCHIAVQKTGPEAMHIKLSDNIYRDGRAYVVHNEKNLRGTLVQFLYAASQYHEKLAKLFGGREDRTKEVFSKDIFLKTPAEKVAYLIYARAYNWYTAPKNENETFGDVAERYLELIVFPKPKDMNFAELAELADRQKKEREDAWKFPPKSTPELPGLHEALRDGCRGHAFLSGGGLRVINFSKGKKSVAYGEHPHIEEALCHADEDYLAGGRPYKEVYGKKHPHYLTGATSPTSNIDSWIRQGRTFDVWQDKDLVVVELHGLGETKLPEAIQRTVLETGVPHTWSNRGYTYKIVKTKFPNGEPCTSMSVIRKPPGDTGCQAWMYNIVKTGSGKNIHEAIQNALAAEEIELNQG